MKRLVLFCAALLLLCSHHLQAKKYTPACSGSKKSATHAKTTLADMGEGDYDIKYLKFNLNVTDTSTHIAGDVTTRAQVIAASMTDYYFELDTTLVIDSAKVNGTLLPVSSIGALVRKIALPAALPVGSYFTAQIFYHGTPPGGSGFFNGVTHAVSGGGTHMMYTVSDPWVALNWWPTKQSVDDKIDSVDMFITVPSGVVDGSNGRLVSVDNTSNPGYCIYHWQTHYPIAYYLISMAVAKYAEYRSYWHFSASTDSMLIQNFFIDTATFNPSYKANFDSIGQMIGYFSSVYGRYPFWQEKYGVCYTNLPGGMEHQTMTTIGVPNTYIIAHELTHQWFGDHVSYARWGDVWLSEGFATWSEQLFLERFWGAGPAKTHRQSLLSSALSRPCGMLFVNDTTTSDSLFDGTTVYAKGNGVVNMLRYAAPVDSLFFVVLKTYQNNFAFGNASTADLKNVAETVYGTNLDTFFNQWVYGRGYPVYKASWNQVGSTVFVKLIQTPSCPSATPHFNTYLELQLHSATADTIIKVYNNLDTQVFSFDWAPTVANLYVNPDVWTVCKVQTPILHDATLSVGAVVPTNIRVSPNPSEGNWRIENIPADSELVLTDVNGKMIWKGKSVAGTNLVPGEHLPAGNYFLRINGQQENNVQLVHW